MLSVVPSLRCTHPQKFRAQWFKTQLEIRLTPPRSVMQWRPMLSCICCDGRCQRVAELEFCCKMLIEQVFGDFLGDVGCGAFFFWRLSGTFRVAVLRNICFRTIVGLHFPLKWIMRELSSPQTTIFSLVLCNSAVRSK